MGRPELPLDPQAGPVAAFACDLRVLREAAGAPSYRSLARRTHYSVTTLSQAAAGRTVPTLPVLLAFVTECGGDTDVWEARWRTLTRQSAEQGSPDPDPVPPSPASTPVRPSRFRPAFVAVVFVGLLTGWTVHLSDARHTTTASPAAAAMGVSSCDRTAVILDSVGITSPGTPPRDTLGTVSLRYSPSCGLAWARFLPAPATSPASGVATLSVHRVSDGATTVLRLPQIVAAESDPLLTVPGCVYAQVTITFAHGVTATARTTCRQG